MWVFTASPSHPGRGRQWVYLPGAATAFSPRDGPVDRSHGLQDEQLVAVQEEQPEDDAEDRKSPEAADPLLNPKEEKSFFMSLLPQREQHSAASDMLRAKYSKVPPQSPHLYS